jgi:hypothetical protein
MINKLYEIVHPTSNAILHTLKSTSNIGLLGSAAGSTDLVNKRKRIVSN